MENLSSTPIKKSKNKKNSPHKLVIVLLTIGVATSLIFAFLFYNQSKDWQNRFSQLTEEHNKLASRVFQIAGQKKDGLSQTQPQSTVESQQNESNGNNIEPKQEETKQPEPVSREAAIISAVEKANPAVASIIISKDVPKLELYYEEPFGNDPFFNNFNLKIPRYRQKGTEKKQVGAGTGFLVTKDGLLITNKHVVTDQDAEYAVLLSDGQQYVGTVLARDPLNDIAFVKIEGKDFPYINLGDSDKIKLGQTVIAIGNALGEFQNSVSTGIVSGLKRTINAGNQYGQSVEQLENVIQTDAAINPGNSGGPLLDLQGEVIGVNVAVASAQNIGFSLPVNDIKKRLQEVEETGKIMRPTFGIRYTLINKALQEKLKLSVDYGALLAKGEEEGDLAVIPGSPADKAGLKEGDIILEINATKVTLGNSLSKIMSQYSVGDEIGLRVLRDEKEIIVKVVLEELK